MALPPPDRSPQSEYEPVGESELSEHAFPNHLVQEEKLAAAGLTWEELEGLGSKLPRDFEPHSPGIGRIDELIQKAIDLSEDRQKPVVFKLNGDNILVAYPESNLSDLKEELAAATSPEATSLSPSSRDRFQIEQTYPQDKNLERFCSALDAAAQAGETLEMIGPGDIKDLATRGNIDQKAAVLHRVAIHASSLTLQEPSPERYAMIAEGVATTIEPEEIRALDEALKTEGGSLQQVLINLETAQSNSHENIRHPREERGREWAESFFKLTSAHRHLEMLQMESDQ